MHGADSNLRAPRCMVADDDGCRVAIARSTELNLALRVRREFLEMPQNQERHDGTRMYDLCGAAPFVGFHWCRRCRYRSGRTTGPSVLPRHAVPTSGRFDRRKTVASRHRGVRRRSLTSVSPAPTQATMWVSEQTAYCTMPPNALYTATTPVKTPDSACATASSACNCVRSASR